MERRLDLDWSLVLATLGLLSIGLVTLANTGESRHLASRQLLWVGVGGGIALAAGIVGYRRWATLAPFVYVANAALLLYVLQAGLRVHGSKSWLDLGPFNVQPSEFMKIATVLLASRVLASERDRVAGWRTLLGLGVVIGIPLVLVGLQPDYGTAMTFAAIGGSYLLVAGLGRRAWLIVLLAGVVAGAGLWSFGLKPYQKARIQTFLSPEVDPHSMGYQVIQSRIAIGSGGLGGRGLNEGTQSRLDFLPEKSTDFIFAVTAEAWGFTGVLIILGLYGVVLAVGLRIALHAADAYGTYLVVGIMAMFAVHVLVNLGMVTGLLPTIGIPLPLMSYGGSSLVTTLAGIGLVLNVGMRRADG